MRLPAMFTSSDYPHDFLKTLDYFRRIRGNPSRSDAARNGRLVMDLTFWGDDTQTVAERVRSAFDSFQ